MAHTLWCFLSAPQRSPVPPVETCGGVEERPRVAKDSVTAPAATGRIASAAMPPMRRLSEIDGRRRLATALAGGAVDRPQGPADSSTRTVQTDVLDIAYEEHGSPTAPRSSGYMVSPTTCARSTASSRRSCRPGIECSCPGCAATARRDFAIRPRREWRSRRRSPRTSSTSQTCSAFSASRSGFRLGQPRGLHRVHPRANARHRSGLDRRVLRAEHAHAGRDDAGESSGSVLVHVVLQHRARSCCA